MKTPTVRTLTMCALAFCCSAALADSGPDLAMYEDRLLEEQQFLREYPMGVYRHRVHGGRLYGWKVRPNITLGRFKGETDEFGFSFEVNRRDRVEFTTGGLRWRRAVGGSR